MDVFDICQQIRMDAGKGKKCPGGYSIPANKQCGGKKKMRSPGGNRFSPGSFAVGGVLGAAGGAYAVGRAMQKGSERARAKLAQRTAEVATGKSGTPSRQGKKTSPPRKPGTQSSVQDPGEKLRKENARQAAELAELEKTAGKVRKQMEESGYLKKK